MVDIVEREVFLLAHSQPTVGIDNGWYDAVNAFIPEEAETAADDMPFSPDGVMEFAGRTCYDAYGRKNPDTRENRDYIANIMRQNHRSVLEHSSFTFLLHNISRAATHEIVRHRHFSFSQESQRFVHGRNRNVVVPEKVLRNGPVVPAEQLLNPATEEVLDAAFDRNERLYDQYRDAGWSHKEAAEAARSVLPNAAATSIVVTGNLRSWVEFVEKRSAPGADAELQAIAQEVTGFLEKFSPAVFGKEARKLWNGEAVQHGPKK